MDKVDTTVDRTGELWRIGDVYKAKVVKSDNNLYLGFTSGITLGQEAGWEMVDTFKAWARKVRKEAGVANG